MPLNPVPRNTLLYSIVIPVYNEEANIGATIERLDRSLTAEGIPFELVVVNDSSGDHTADVVRQAQQNVRQVRLIENALPRGFGRAVRKGLGSCTGEAVALVMADLSDSPGDIVQCYRVLEEGYDCVFGSRFIKGSRVTSYPRLKLLINRLVNNAIRLLFLTRHNDLTNAFKVYRRHVLESIGPLHASHFNITIELSLSVIIRRFNVAQIPISWSGRTWGQSKMRLRQMGRRYLCTLLKVWFEGLLIRDDLLEESRRRNP